jgi:GTPase
VTGKGLSGRPSPGALFGAATRGDRRALGRLVSMIERGGEAARAVGRLSFPRSGQAFTLGITGAPGAGKSTLTDGLVGVLRATGLMAGVLAVDPSSPFSGGAILGDRVRMQSHALDSGVFIRSMATRGHIGGLALAVPEALRLLDAVGFEQLLVETVGVGQVELDVAGATDTTVVVVTPGWGDSVQANKAGLMEIADVFVVNKADRPGAGAARRDLEAMLDLSNLEGWRPPVIEAVAEDGQGVAEVWDAVMAHRDRLAGPALQERRRHRLERELDRIILRRIDERVGDRRGQPAYVAVVEEMASRRVDPYEAADRLLEVAAGG